MKHKVYLAHIQGLRNHPIITVWPHIIKIVKIMIKKKYSYIIIGLKSDTYSISDYTWIIIIDNNCYNKVTKWLQIHTR